MIKLNVRRRDKEENPRIQNIYANGNTQRRSQRRPAALPVRPLKREQPRPRLIPSASDRAIRTASNVQSCLANSCLLNAHAVLGVPIVRLLARLRGHPYIRLLIFSLYHLPVNIPIPLCTRIIYARALWSSLRMPQRKVCLGEMRMQRLREQ